MKRMPRLLADGRGRRLGGLALLAVGQAAAAAASAIAIRDTFGHLGDPTLAFPTAALATLIVAGGLYALCYWSTRVVAEALGHDYANTVRLQVFSHVSALPTDTLARYRSGGLSLRFVGDLAAVRGWIGRGLAPLLAGSIVLPAILIVFYVLDPRMVSVAAGALGIGLVLMAVFGRVLPTTQRQLRTARARLAGDATERVVHAPHLRLLGRLPQERRRLMERADRVRRVAVRRQRRTSLLRVIPDVAQALAATGILWIALSTGLPTGDAAAALAALALMTQPIRELAGVWDRYAAWRHARERCEQLLSVPRLRSRRRLEKHSNAGDRESVPVRLRAVSYGPLQSIGAKIRPGRKIGITGPNGGGKSLLLRLVAGLLAPDQGTVRVDRIEPAGANGRSRRDLLSYSGANAPVLSGTLRRALTLGARRRPDDRAIERVANHFGLAAVLNRLGGLDGRVAENGRNLSTGECRRILLARTLLADAPLWLLDEPDEALDQAGRQALRQALAQTASTVMLVSHDWSTLALCDEVWFIEDGRLVEIGDPRDLLQHKGSTARFFAFDRVG